MEHARTIRFAIGLAVVVVVLLLSLWHVVDVLLVIFASVLFAIFLRGLADLLDARTGLGPRWSLLAVILALLTATGGLGWALAGNVATQIEQLSHELPRALEGVRDWLEGREWGQLLLAWGPTLEDAMTEQNLVVQAPGMLTRTLGVTFGILTNIVIIVVLGIYLAADWNRYGRGLLRLVPPARRERAAEVMGALRETLQWWIIGKVVVMTAVAVTTGIGFWLLDVPLALTLALLAGLFEFIPYVGPLLGFAPAILLALTRAPSLALYVTGLWVVVQSLESYVLTPLVQQHAVHLPPALTIAAQVVLTVLLGPLGLVLATPLAAVGVVLVKMLYVEDVLGDRGEPLPPRMEREAPAPTQRSA